MYKEKEKIWAKQESGLTAVWLKWDPPVFPTEDLRQAVETAKRILTKEKIDRQLAGQSFSMPFVNMKDGDISKKVTFDTQDSLDEKIDRLTSMMNKLAAQDDNQTKQFKPKYIKAKEEDR